MSNWIRVKIESGIDLRTRSITPKSWIFGGREISNGIESFALNLMVAFRRSHRVYTTVALAVILSIVVVPLLTNHQIHLDQAA